MQLRGLDVWVTAPSGGTLRVQEAATLGMGTTETAYIPFLHMARHFWRLGYTSTLIPTAFIAWEEYDFDDSHDL